MTMPQPQSPDRFGLEGGSKISWFRILRHMPPHKVKRLLLEHDHFEQMLPQLDRD
jgi:hypothetical protein